MSTEAVTPAWHARSADDVLESLVSSPQGLTEADVRERRAVSGPNALETARATPAWLVLARQFRSPLILILVGAAAVTTVLEKWFDTAAIVLVLVLNASIGFWQERKAAAEIRALTRIANPLCRARRDGRAQSIPAVDLVPGDIVLLESGERVAADLRVLDAAGLQIDESMLTGEVLAATKSSTAVAEQSSVGDRQCMAFMGTFVVSGRGLGVVVATGAATELGQINELVQGATPRTPLQQLFHRLEARIGILVGIVCTVIFAAGIILGGDLGDVFLSAVALAVASIPEALPVVLTIALSIGVARMARAQAVVRTLPAVETLGSTTVIGSDKTGTLTQNLLTVEELWTPHGRTVLNSDGTRSPDGDALVLEMVRAGALTNEATPNADARAGFVGDAVDVAMAAVAVHLDALAAESVGSRSRARTPYEPELGYSQAVVTGADGRHHLVVKGAPDTLIERSILWRTVHGDEEIDRQVAHDANHEMGRRGLRVIATATRAITADEFEDGTLPEPARLTFLGMQGMADPPRPGVAEAVARCQDAGITVMMITGDHPVTAEAIAGRLGIACHAAPITGAEMALIDDEILAARLRETSVAARVSPQDKLRIVSVLQSRGEVVAVTGDGVNDAPALKAASIGVAMGASGTDVAREAADLVLTDDNFVTIVTAVREGRVTFAAIRKATYFLLSTATAVVIAVTFNVFAEAPLLFLPIQVLWMNLVTNGLQDVALAFEPAEGGELRRPPRPRAEGLLSATLWRRLVVTGLWMAAAILLVFSWALDNGYSDDHARTLALTVVISLNFFQAGNSRAEHRSLFRLNPLSNPFLLATSVGSMVLHFLATATDIGNTVLSLVPLSATEWVACLAIGATVVVVSELDKLAAAVHRRRPWRRPISA
jgi:P-type Ca2+ transporter type 2C